MSGVGQKKLEDFGAAFMDVVSTWLAAHTRLSFAPLGVAFAVTSLLARPLIARHGAEDFTVTPQSYEATLSTLKKMLPPGKKLLVLTGSCGDRMKEKRPTVGKIVSHYADIMVVTNEDPYTEDPEKIIDAVWAGVDQSKTEAHRISDRKEAIEFLLKKATEGDIVIFCGKGSDTTMWVKEGQIPWDERKIVKEMLHVFPLPAGEG